MNFTIGSYVYLEKKTLLKKEIFSSERFNFKPLQVEDVGSEYLSWFEDDVTKKFIIKAQEMSSLKKLQDYVAEKDAKSNCMMWGFFDKVSKAHIGNIKYEPINWKTQKAVMGILIGNVSWRGKKVSAEVLMATMAILKKYDLKWVYLGVDKENVAAQKSYLSLGFKVIDEEVDGIGTGDILKMVFDLEKL